MIDYIIKKTKNEYEYYLLIFNNVDEIGESSKKAFTELYENINIKTNETFSNLIENEIYFYLDIFVERI